MFHDKFNPFNYPGDILLPYNHSTLTFAYVRPIEEVAEREIDGMAPDDVVPLVPENNPDNCWYANEE